MQLIICSYKISFTDTCLCENAFNIKSLTVIWIFGLKLNCWERSKAGCEEKKRVKFGYGFVMSLPLTYKKNRSPFSHNKIPE